MKFIKLVNTILEAKQYSGLQQQANALMNQDQKYNNNPNGRINWQKNTVQPFISKNISNILADNKDNGNYPHAPYACWVLVQHMDAFVDYQEYFCKEMEKVIPKFSKLKFLKDRIIVNREILSLWNKQTDKDANGQPLNNPTADLRDSNRFPPLQGAKPPRSAKEAYEQILKANNNPLFIKALQAAYKKGVTTQPSYQL